MSLGSLVPALPITEDYEAEDEDTYVASNTSTPFTVPHSLAPIEASGPSTSNLSRSFTAMPDNACPSGPMVNTLGLRRRPLAKEEDNLSSLTGEMKCQDYVRLEFTSGKGAWSSGVFTAKVCENLPVDILLGMHFSPRDDLSLILSAARSSRRTRATTSQTRPQQNANGCQSE
jgi:hypothetical protein